MGVFHHPPTALRSGQWACPRRHHYRCAVDCLVVGVLCISLSCRRTYAERSRLRRVTLSAEERAPSLGRFLFLSLVRQLGSKEVALGECRNILKRVIYWRDSLPEVDVFAMFLEDLLQPEDLDFLLYLQQGNRCERGIG